MEKYPQSSVKICAICGKPKYSAEMSFISFNEDKNRQNPKKEACLSADSYKNKIEKNLLFGDIRNF